MTNDIEILLKDLFAKHTDYGKIPTQPSHLLNKFTDEELAVVLSQFLYANNLILNVNE